MMKRYRTKRLVLSLWCMLELATASAQVQTAILEYWFDTHFNERISMPISNRLEQQIDVSQLSMGIHTMEMRVSDTKGRWGAPLIRYFLKSETRLDGNVLDQYEYCIDGQWENSKKGIFADGEVILDLDIRNLCGGMHSLMVRVYDAKGQESQTLVRYFLTAHEDVTKRQLTGYRYWIDDYSRAQSGQTADGNIMLDIDANSLSKGLHSLGYQVADNTGRMSSPRLLYFVVPDLEKESDLLVAYEYWFNHGPRKRVELEPQQSIDAAEWQVEVKDIVPDRIPADFTFDTATEKVSFHDDVFFGMQVFNGNGKGSQAVLSDTVNMEVTITPEMFELGGGSNIRFASPKGGAIMGWKINCLAGDSITYHLTSEQVQADFFGADGQKLIVNKTTDEDGRICYGVIPRGFMCYMLLCNALTDSIGFAIEVTNAVPGDVNGDRHVTVSDVVMAVNHVLGDVHPQFNEDVADLNKDKKVTMGDVVLLVDLVLQAEEETHNGGKRAFAHSDVQDYIEIHPFTLSRNNVVDIELANQTPFTAFQMDVQLPERVRIVEDGGIVLGQRATDSHRLNFLQRGDNTVRIMGWSVANRPFDGQRGGLLSLQLTSDGTQPSKGICITQILFTTPDGKEYMLPDTSFFAMPTGIQSVANEKAKGTVYDLQGRKTERLKEGIYVVNGKKTIVKTEQP